MSSQKRRRRGIAALIAAVSVAAFSAAPVLAADVPGSAQYAVGAEENAGAVIGAEQTVQPAEPGSSTNGTLSNAEGDIDPDALAALVVSAVEQAAEVAEQIEETAQVSDEVFSDPGTNAESSETENKEEMDAVRPEADGPDGAAVAEPEPAADAAESEPEPDEPALVTEEAAAEAAPLADVGGEGGTIGEIVDPNVIKFEKGAPEVRIISYYPLSAGVSKFEPEILGGGTVYQGRDEVEVTEGLTYEWWLLAGGQQTGRPISTNELMKLEAGYNAYNPDQAITKEYREIIRLSGNEVARQTFRVQVVSSIPTFPLTATGTTAGKDSPVVLTAEIPADYDATVEKSLKNANDIASGVSLQRSAVRWYPDGYGTVGTNDKGQPTLTLEGAPQASSGALPFRCIVDYEITGTSQTGVVRAHSDIQNITVEEATLPPYWVTEPGTSDDSVVACSRFKYSPVTESELQQLYKTLILPYYDPAYRNQPFRLKAAQTNADGSLSEASQQQLFNFINFIRRCAGVDPIGSIDPQKSSYAQAGTQFMSDHNTIGHYAAVGSGDAAADYGLQHSNLSWGKISGAVYDLTEMQMNQFEEDDAANTATLGHRRWLLDNRLKSTGFGYTGPTKANPATHLATFVMDKDNEYYVPGHSFEAFPGIGAFPVELLTFKAWSLGLGDGTRAPATGVRMSVTRDDGKSVELRRLENPSHAFNSSGDWFTVDSKGCGSGPVIIFNPGSMFEGGDVRNGKALLGHTYTMCITGLTTGTGFPSEPVVYSTRFVSLAALTDQYDPGTAPTSPVQQDPPEDSKPTQPGEESPTNSPGQAQDPGTVTPPAQSSDARPTNTPSPEPTMTPDPTPEPVPTPTLPVPTLPVPADVGVLAPAETAGAVPAPSASAPEAEQTQLPQEGTQPSESAGAEQSAGAEPSASALPSVPAVLPESPVAVEDAADGELYVVIHSTDENSADKLSVDALLRSFDVPDGIVSVVTAQGEPAHPEAPAATGMMVRITDEDGTIRSEYPVVVPYDVLGTGVIDLTQVVRLASAYVGKEPLEGAFLAAGSQVRPGQICLTDLVRQVRLYIRNAAGH